MSGPEHYQEAERTLARRRGHHADPLDAFQGHFA
jgi:hypothetical protein